MQPSPKDFFTHGLVAQKGIHGEGEEPWTLHYHNTSCCCQSANWPGPQNPTVVRQLDSGGRLLNLFATLWHDFGRKNCTREKSRRLTRFLTPDALRRVPVGSFLYTKGQLPGLGTPFPIADWLQERTKTRASIFHRGKCTSRLWIAISHLFRDSRETK